MCFNNLCINTIFNFHQYENRRWHDVSLDITEDTHAREEEIKELRCLPVDDCPKDGSMTATPASMSAAPENLVSHLKSLRTTISKSASSKSILNVF